MKKTLALIFAVLMIVSCFTACGGTESGDDTSDAGTTLSNGINGIKVPEENLDGVKNGSFAKFTAVDLAGKKVTEDIFKGKKLTMINIWATFCGPCINEMPDLEKLSQDYADKDFQIIGMVCDVNYSYDGTGYDKDLYASALDVVEMTGVTYTNLLPSASLDKIKLSEVYSVPETIFVDENGEVVDTNYIGSRSYENWKEIVDSILETM